MKTTSNGVHATGSISPTQVVIRLVALIIVTAFPIMAFLNAIAASHDEMSIMAAAGVVIPVVEIFAYLVALRHLPGDVKQDWMVYSLFFFAWATQVRVMVVTVVLICE